MRPRMADNPLRLFSDEDGLRGSSAHARNGFVRGGISGRTILDSIVSPALPIDSRLPLPESDAGTAAILFEKFNPGLPQSGLDFRPSVGAPP